MSEDSPLFDENVLREVMLRNLTRRGFLRGAGAGAAAFGVGSLLAACGGGGGGTAGGESMDPTEIFGKPPGDKIMFANWPLYIDKSKDASGKVYYPSLSKFQDATGISTDYEAIIQENASFFGKIQPQLAAGDPTGWDIIVITNGRQLTALIANDWVYPLDASKRPNFDANAALWAKNPAFDPDNAHTMAWQSGFTGIGYNSKMTNGPITTMDDLANPDKVGTASVGMLTQDMADLVMINLGIDPTTSTPDDWREAAKWLEMQKASGTVRQYYDQGYMDDFLPGNLSATMAWSGDVISYHVWGGYPELEWVWPEGGALLWIDNMMIPVGAANPSGALQLMDWYYKPEIATGVTEFVNYMSPVPATKDLILQDAQKAADQGDKETAGKLEEMANNPYLYPDAAQLQTAYFAREQKTDAEIEEWDSIFLPIVEG